MNADTIDPPGPAGPPGPRGPTAESPESPVPSGTENPAGTPPGLAGAPAEAQEVPDPGGVPQLLRLVGSVVAPTSLLTGLLVYFGQTYITGYCRYFGVNFTALNLSVQDYLIRSVDGVFVPLTVTAVAALVAFWVNRVLGEVVRSGGRRAALRVAVPLGTLGLGLLALATAELATNRTQLLGVPELGGLSLAAGIILLHYVVGFLPAIFPRARAGTLPTGWSPARWGAEFVLVSIGLFWAVGSYANGVGATRAEQLQGGLSAWPDTVLYSSESLDLTGPGLTETSCRDAHSAYRYRVDGLKLVLQSGDEYFFLPAGWTPDDGAAILLPRTDAIRLEFTRARPAGALAC